MVHKYYLLLLKFAGRTGKCTVDRTEKGWYIAWIDRDPETIARQEALAKKDKMAKDDEERLAAFISKQVEKGNTTTSSTTDEKEQATELMRISEDEKVTLSFSSTKQKSADTKPNIKVRMNMII